MKKDITEKFVLPGRIIDELQEILELERQDAILLFRRDGAVPMYLEKQAPGFSQADHISIPNAFVDEVDAIVFRHHLMVFV